MKKRIILSGISFVCLIMFLMVGRCHFTSKGKVEFIEELSPLCLDDQTKIKELFEHHFFFSDFAYTLFGSKPMSIGRLQPTLKAQQGWEAWEKIKNSFPSRDFVIRKYLFNNHEFILIANLKSIEKIYLESKPFFILELKREVSLETLIDAIKQDGPLFQELMSKHALLGILLGYGANNAELFAKNKESTKSSPSLLQPFSKRIHPIFYLFSEIMPVSFACDPSTEETQQLKKLYTKEREIILQKAKQEPLFTQMLHQLKR